MRMLFIGLITAFLFVSPLLADESPAPEPKPAPPAPDATPDATPEPPPPLHKVYVPYRDLAKIFEKEGEGVFLPYEEFLQLWKRAHRVKPDAGKPPIAVAIRQATYVGRVEKDVITLEAHLDVDVMDDGWQRVPLDFQGAGVESAVIEDEKALVVPGPKGKPTLLLEGKGRRTLDLVLRIPTTRKGDVRSSTFHLPPVPLSRMTLDVPGGATEIQLEPDIARTTQSMPGEVTRLLAFLGPVNQLQLSWRIREEEKPDLQPLVFADQRHDVHASPGVLRTESVIDLSILRAPLSHLRLAVPADAVTLYVQADGLRTWRRSDDGTTIDLDLREPVKERWQVRVGLEHALPVLPADVALPLPAVDGVERETGFVRLVAREGVKVEPLKTVGLRQVDVVELPEALRKTKVGRATGWRFASRPEDVRARIDALEPRVDIDIGQRLVIRPEGTELQTGLHLRVDRAGIFGLDILLPADLEVTKVEVLGHARYDDHKVKDVDGKRVLHVAFRDRLLGIALVSVYARRTTPLPPEEDEGAKAAFDTPLLAPVGAAHVSGYVAVHVDPALEHREVSKTGLVAMDRAAPAAQEPPDATTPLPPLARRFEHHQAEVDLSLSLWRRDPAISARVETALRLEPDRMRVAVTLRYDVRYRGVDTFRFSAPLSVESLLHLDLEGVQLLGPEPIEVEEGEPVRGTWTIKLPAERMGQIPIPLEVEDVPDVPLASGASRDVPIPTIVPLEATGEVLPNVVHQVAIRRDPLLEVRTADLEQVEEIDPRELPATLKGDDDFLALRAYTDTWAAALHVTRHDYEPIAEVVVSHMHLDTVLSDERATTEAYLKVQNNDRQNLKLKLPAGASIRALTVDGQTRTPRRGDDEATVLVPLPSGLGKDEAFVVAIAYDHDVERDDWLLYESWKAETPIPEAVTPDLLTWRVFLPEDRVYTGFGGTVRPSQPYRSWFSGLVNGLFSFFGRRAPSGHLDVRRAAQGYESPFGTRHEGTMFLFDNRVGTGTVEVTGADEKSFAFYQLLWFVLFLAGVLLLARIAGTIGLGEGTFVLGVIVVLLVLLVSAEPGSTKILNAMLWGTLLAGCVRLMVHGVAARRVRGAARAKAEAAAEVAAAEEAEAIEEGGEA